MLSYKPVGTYAGAPRSLTLVWAMFSQRAGRNSAGETYRDIATVRYSYFIQVTSRGPYDSNAVVTSAIKLK